MAYPYEELTTEQARALIGLKHTASVRQAIRRGSLEAVKRGRDYIILRKEAERYKEENRRA